MLEARREAPQRNECFGVLRFFTPLVARSVQNDERGIWVQTGAREGPMARPESTATGSHKSQNHLSK